MQATIGRIRSRGRWDLGATAGRAAFALVGLAVLVGAGAVHAEVDPRLTRADAPPGARAVAGADPAGAGTGELYFRSDAGWVPGRMVEVELDVSVTGIVVRGVLEQSFSNPTGDTLDARYVFPLPEGAAVHRMTMTIGERRIESRIEEKAEARRVFERARTEGRKAALVESSRPNLFRTEVTGVNPGEVVAVRLEWIQEAEYRDGAFGVVLPLAYTPRFGGIEWGGADRSAEGATRAVALPAAAERGPARFVAAPPTARVTVRLDLGVEVDSLDSPSHAIDTVFDGDVLEAAPRGGRVPCDRDFVLRWNPLRRPDPQVATLTEIREDGRYALTLLVPPVERIEAGHATETLWVVDVSSSMQGPSMRQARRAMQAALDGLRPGDRFEIVAFNDGVHPFANGFVPVGAASVDAARHWVDSLHAHGGTRIGQALAHAAAASWSDDGPARRIVLVTDGAVGHESAFLRRIVNELHDVRLHVLGIGQAPNRWFVREMARAGRGLCDFVRADGEAGAGMRRFLERVERPALTDLELHGLDDGPRALADLHLGEPAVLTFRLPAGEPERLTLTGTTGDGSPFSMPLTLSDGVEPGSGVAVRWAKGEIEALLDGLHRGVPETTVRPAVVALALEHGIATRYTSFVAEELFPTTNGSTARADVANAVRVDGDLARGGTTRPFWRRLGLWSVLLGSLLVWVFRRAAV